MKNLKVTVALFLASWFLMVQTGCFGRFALVKKVYEFNDSVGGKDLGGRFVKQLLYMVMIIVPVYELAGLIDSIILNLIEFWTGSNPIAMAEGEQEIQLVRKDNELYKLTATKNQMHVKQLQGANAGQELTFVWQPQQNAWYLHCKGEITKLADLQFGLMTTTAHFYLPNGVVLQENMENT
ncbi:MAG: DUF3332 domain-containing protein [Flavobacteriales bacterium]|nr:DUF3332 domain-containing protein [Flavobacteriales bacterium]